MTQKVRREIPVKEIQAGTINRGLESLLSRTGQFKNEKLAVIIDFGRYKGCTLQVCYSLTDYHNAEFWISGETEITLKLAQEIREIYSSDSSIIWGIERVYKYPK